MIHASATRWLPLATFGIALALALPMLRPLAPPALVPPATTPMPAVTAAMESDFLPNPAASAHSVSLAELRDGRIGAAWFAGSKEGAADVRILFATFDGSRWSDPLSVTERERAQRDTGRLVRKLGNPVLWCDDRGTLHLWFVSVGFGGWGGSALNDSRSADNGRTWSAAERRVTSPFLNLSTLVRGAPVALEGGAVALPVYHEFVDKHPEWLRLDADGNIVDKLRLPNAHALLQPSAAALDERRILALLRDAGSDHRIHVARSEDAGSHWSEAEPTSLPNPNAGIALLRLADGRLLLASNPQESGRNRLALQVSTDQGNTWSPPRLVEEGSNDDEYSYPALLQDRRGVIHLAYTWKREKIRHHSFRPQDLGDQK